MSRHASHIRLTTHDIRQAARQIRESGERSTVETLSRFLNCERKVIGSAVNCRLGLQDVIDYDSSPLKNGIAPLVRQDYVQDAPLMQWLWARIKTQRGVYKIRSR